jgi:hypothetical protein
MAKRGRILPARRQQVEDALLIRSAESLGRMIGTLQRQLDGASKKLSSAGGIRLFGMDGQPDGDGHQHPATAIGVGARKTSRASKATKSGSKSGATKMQSTADRKSKRASKSAAAKKTAGRSRSGASRKPAKSRPM